jgi:hypothetical protein
MRKGIDRETDKSKQLCCVVGEWENSGMGRKHLREVVARRTEKGKQRASS